MTAQMATPGMSSESESGPSLLRTYHSYLPSPLPTAPAFHLHLTRLKDTLFVWVGTASADADELAGAEPHGGSKKLAADWSVSMPSRGNIPITATPIYRSSSSDAALAMSQRLAKKFPGNQVHLSLSLSEGLTPTQGSSLDPFASKVLLIMEKRLGGWLEELLKGETDVTGC